jgi:hypothetical protein
MLLEVGSCCGVVYGLFVPAIILGVSLIVELGSILV